MESLSAVLLSTRGSSSPAGKVAISISEAVDDIFESHHHNFDVNQSVLLHRNLRL